MSESKIEVVHEDDVGEVLGMFADGVTSLYVAYDSDQEAYAISNEPITDDVLSTLFQDEEEDDE